MHEQARVTTSGLYGQLDRELSGSTFEQRLHPVNRPRDENVKLKQNALFSFIFSKIFISILR